MAKKTDKYTLKIPKELKNLFQEYIEKNPGLGFNKVSQFALHILQQKAMEIKEDLDKNFS